MVSGAVSPRLQLRWALSPSLTPKRKWECHYELVLPLSYDDPRCEVFNDAGEVTNTRWEFVIAMKPPSLRGPDVSPSTTQDGSLHWVAPQRDLAYAKSDSAALGGLPVYVVASDGEAFRQE